MRFAVSATEGAAPPKPGRARRGRLAFPDGSTVETPAFMPVATRGTVMALAPHDVEALGYEMILMNTYHLHVRPGEDSIRARGGLRRFFRWERPILTDSGGFQVLSFTRDARASERAERVAVDDDGVTFASHLDGARKRLTPESVLSIQHALGSDVWMCLDHCPPHSEDRSLVEEAARRTLRWAERSRTAYEALPEPRGALFGVVQGGTLAELREANARALAALDFSGYALGGLSVGESKEQTLEMTSLACAALPEEKPRYLMGVGTPRDIVECVARGVDLFDCVIPTRNARNGTLYTRRGKISLKRRELAGRDDPPDAECACFTCRNFSLAYLRTLWKQKEISSMRLNTIHNLAFYADLMRDSREAIERKNFAEWKEEVVRGQEADAEDQESGDSD
jgi:queuine tRNA-ribosyltransferase